MRGIEYPTAPMTWRGIAFDLMPSSEESRFRSGKFLVGQDALGLEVGELPQLIGDHCSRRPWLSGRGTRRDCGRALAEQAMGAEPLLDLR